DVEMHEFRALALFAMGNYEESAAVLYGVLSAGPGWNWDTVKGLYSSIDEYTAHLRALEAHRSSNPDDMAARFVLAYHYQATDYKEDAARQLQIVHQNNPDDRLVAELLQRMNPDAS